MQTDQPSLYIGGRYVTGQQEKSFDTINPATGESLARIYAAGPKDVDRAVATAREGFLQWSQKTGAERGQVLMRAAAILRERNDDLAALEVADTGKPIAEASTVDVTSGADALTYFGGIAASIQGEHIQLGQSFAYTRREPLGVCAGIGAWNYPLQIACWKSAPALACGNSMIFKPAELTPLTALKLAEIYTEAGLPPGVFNVVQGDAEVGQMLTRHRGIAKVSLTGEVGTGRLVMADAAATLKHVTMELGGKSPLILFDDCDLNNAVSAALMANFYTQGEICSNGTRVFVQRNLYGAFVDSLLGRVGRMKVGDPTDPTTDVGALISHEHLQKVLGYIAQGKKEGAKLVCGGEQLRTGALAKGNFVAPTVFTDCTDEMTITREEIFGPVMCVLPFFDEAEVIGRANATEYGLAAGVFTRDLQRAHRVAAALQAGICWINNYNLTPVEVPFGGVKQSGVGRENGLAAVQHYTQLKTVYVEMGDVVAPY